MSDALRALLHLLRQGTLTPAAAPAAFIRAEADPALRDLLPALVCEQTFKPDYDRLAALGCAVSLRAQGPCGTALCLLTKNKSENLANIARAWSVLASYYENRVGSWTPLVVTSPLAPPTASVIPAAGERGVFLTVRYQEAHGAHFVPLARVNTTATPGTSLRRNAPSGLAPGRSVAPLVMAISARSTPRKAARSSLSAT